MLIHIIFFTISQLKVFFKDFDLRGISGANKIDFLCPSARMLTVHLSSTFAKSFERLLRKTFSKVFLKVLILFSQCPLTILRIYLKSRQSELFMNFPPDYKESLSKEAKFWARDALRYEASGYEPDITKRIKLKDGRHFWDNPDIEDILVGDIRDSILKNLNKKIPANGRVLELGCGSGWLSLEFAKIGKKTFATDISLPLLETGSRYNKKISLPSSVTFFQSDLNTIGLKLTSLDVVVCWGVLHHVLLIGNLLDTVSNSLKPGGMFIVFDHIGYTMKHRLLARLWSLMTPSRKTLFHRLSSPFVKLFTAKKKSDNEGSPFEQVTQAKMVSLIETQFSVTKKIELLGLIHHFIMDVPVDKGYDTIKKLKKWDDFLIRNGFIKGNYIYMECRKK